MKRILITFLITHLINIGFAQTTTVLAPGEYKSVDIGDNGYGDYTRNLILLHEIYDGTLINTNYAIGTITAIRGHIYSFNRLTVANINSSSSYSSTIANVTSAQAGQLGENTWKLKTCLYNNKRYLALDVPYWAAYHNHGYKFTGWTTSTGENMKSVAYQVNGQPVNQNILSDIQDYIPNMDMVYDVAQFSVTGNVGIGTTAPKEKLSVNGKIRAHEVKVETANWPDYVFEEGYKVGTLEELESYIKTNKHLPEVPSAKEVAANGVELGEMNKILLKKIEELTLHLIEKDKEITKERTVNENQKKEIVALQQNYQELKNIISKLIK